MKNPRVIIGVTAAFIILTLLVFTTKINQVKFEDPAVANYTKSTPCVITLNKWFHHCRLWDEKPLQTWNGKP